MPAHHAHHKGQHPRHQPLTADVEPPATPFEIALLRASALTPPERESNTDPAAHALAEFKAGRGPLAAVYARQLVSWTLRGTEIAALTDALFIWRAQVDFCSRGELAAARAYVERRSLQVQRSAHNPGARIVGVGTASANTGVA